MNINGKCVLYHLQIDNKNVSTNGACVIGTVDSRYKWCKGAITVQISDGADQIKS